MKSYDVVVIGGGPGGYVAAIRASQKGLSACLIERGKVGGTCLNRGCIPSKSLFYSAKTISSVKRSEEFGVTVDNFSFALKKAVERKNSVVEKLRSGVEGLLKGNKVEVIKGRGEIEGGSRGDFKINVDGEVIEAKNIIIATGSEPLLIPDLKVDGENVITSTEALNLEEVPTSLLIVGGGVMGCEFASLFSQFGSKVTIVEQLDRILSSEDKQITRVVEKQFKNSGIDILTGAVVKNVEIADGKVTSTLDDGAEVITEKVLVTVGRSFNTSGIGLESIGIELGGSGVIKVNDRMETNVDGIYAIGDVVGGMLLAHVASKEGEVAVNNIAVEANSENVAGRSSNKVVASGNSTMMDYSSVPICIFTDPEVASVGLKEKDAKSCEKDVNIGRFSYLSGSKAMCMGAGEGMVQIVTDTGTGVVLGGSIVGEHATDLIGEIALAVKNGLTAEDIYETIHAHPTLPEMVMEAAEDTLGLAVHKIGRRR